MYAVIFLHFNWFGKIITVNRIWRITGVLKCPEYTPPKSYEQREPKASRWIKTECSKYLSSPK